MRSCLIVLVLLGCTRERGAVEAGGPCRSDFDCRSGYCAGPSGNLACTTTCRHDNECPDGWSCHGVTRSGVVVCAQGDAVPMPH